MHVVCPQCSATNRIPDERLGDGPVCARCKAPLLEAAPFALDDANFDTYIGRTGLPQASPQSATRTEGADTARLSARPQSCQVLPESKLI